MVGSLSIRFNSVLGDDQRAEFAAWLTSHEMRLASWKPLAAPGRTYALVDYAADEPALEALRAFGASTVDAPPLCVLDVAPASPGGCARIVRALGGPGRPAGVREAVAFGASVLVELDDRRTPLALVVDLIDAELSNGAAGRTILPLFGLRDDELAAFASVQLATPDIDRSRIIETYTAPLLGEIEA